MDHNGMLKVVWHELGEPVYGLPKDPFWYCPFCQVDGDGDARFHLMPPDRKGKVRFKCFRCGRRGDEFDFLKELHPNKNFSWQREQLDEIERRFSFPKGVRKPTKKAVSELKCAATNIWSKWEDKESWEELVEICGDYFDPDEGISGLWELIAATLWYDREFTEMKRTSELEHLSECENRDCDMEICQAANERDANIKEAARLRKLRRKMRRLARSGRKRNAYRDK